MFDEGSSRNTIGFSSGQKSTVSGTVLPYIEPGIVGLSTARLTLLRFFVYMLLQGPGLYALTFGSFTSFQVLLVICYAFTAVRGADFFASLWLKVSFVRRLVSSR